MAEENPTQALFSARNLKCHFGSGSLGKWSDSKVSVEQDNKSNIPLQFDSIDVKAGKARMIDEQGTDDVSVLVSLSGVTFVERTGLGNFVFAIVFRTRVPETDEFYAVMSRHVQLLSKHPIPSQYHGKCKAWQ